MRLTKNGKPSRAWRNLTAADPLKPAAVARIRAEFAKWRKTGGLGPVHGTPRVTGVKIRDGMQPFLVEGKVLQKEGEHWVDYGVFGSWIRWQELPK